jgi:solute carrier family 25 (mitochondrial phosphate transporter), member 3
LPGAGKYGFYELFKKKYTDIVGEETAHKYRTTLYLAASASAELIADVLLCPWEAIKVRMQTTIPPFARGTLEGWNKVTSTEGMAGYPPPATAGPAVLARFFCWGFLG